MDEKKTLYLMRHGQTVFNKKKRTQGWVVSHGAASAAFHYVWKENAKVERNGRFQNCCVQKYEFDPENQSFAMVELFNEVYPQ